MLTVALKTMINNLFKKKIDITFIGNKKNYQNINYFFFFSRKNFFKIDC